MIEQTIELLGRKGKCRVTGFEGVVTSVCFDLYGCVQAALTPPTQADGKLGDGHWFDVHRIEIDRATPRAITPPDFAARSSKPEDYDRGAAEKPAPRRVP